MDEAPWLASRDPEAMLHEPHIAWSARKAKLCAAAFGRCVWGALPGEAYRRLLEVGEAEADGLCSRQDLGAALVSAFLDRTFDDVLSAENQSAWTARVAAALINLAGYAAVTKAQQVRPVRQWATALPAARSAAQRRAGSAMCAVVRDLFRPYPAVAINPSCLTATVTSLAEAAYAERSLPGGKLEAVRLWILADALEEAGCDDAAILGHLRGPGPHFRGCWVVDAVTGRR